MSKNLSTGTKEEWHIGFVEESLKVTVCNATDAKRPDAEESLICVARSNLGIYEDIGGFVIQMREKVICVIPLEVLGAQQNLPQAVEVLKARYPDYNVRVEEYEEKKHIG